MEQTEIRCVYIISSTFATGNDRHIAWTGPAVKDDWLLYPWNKEMCAFPNNGILHTSKPIKDDCPVAGID